nr:uncharacterized protein LOC108085266 [Drosophila kikkawai]
MNSVQTAVLKKITQTFEIGQILFNYGARKYTEGSTAATLYRDIRKRYENLTTLLRDDDVNMNKVFEEIKDFAEYMKSLAPSAIATDIDGDIKEENERIRRLIISLLRTVPC